MLIYARPDPYNDWPGRRWRWRIDTFTTKVLQWTASGSIVERVALDKVSTVPAEAPAFLLRMLPR